jgi:hypothetical protein
MLLREMPGIIDGDYDSLNSWEDMLGVFSGRYG